MRGAARLGTREAAGWLVARQEVGRLADDLVDALRRMSGQDLGADPLKWREWWDGLPADWRAKGGGPGEGDAGEPKAPGVHSNGSAQFFGVRSSTLAAVYCVQATAAWEQVREEVKRSVATLPDGAQFGVVAYGGDARAFKRKLVDANEPNRAALGAWLDAVEVEPGADPYAGLSAALDLAGGKGDRPPDADTIFLVALTRPPESALFDDPRHVMLEITARNALLGIRIHSIGDSDGGSSFYLHHLSRQFGGSQVNG
jgi:hypothetical protein